MVERTDGPFHYYQQIHRGVNGDTIRADSYDPGLHVSTLNALTSELEGDARNVPAQMSGAITSDVEKLPLFLVGKTRELAANGRYAVALMGSFAGMVDLFDITVNSLNHRYRTDLAMAMRWAGQAAAYTETKKDDKLVNEKEMGPQIRKNLKPEYDAALLALDDNADHIALKFQQGPTVENVRALVQSGLIPPSAAVLYPGLDLTDADRQSYFAALAYLPSAPDPDPLPDQDDEEDGGHWYDGIVDAGKWTYNHTVVPTVNGMANLGQAILEHPEDLLAMAAGTGLMILGGTGELGGVVLDATGIGAVAGVPINVASAAVIATGATLTGAGGADLIKHASENHNTVLNQAHTGPKQGSVGTAGDPLPASERPPTAGRNWEGRVADNGNGRVWQDPASANAPKGSPKNANTLRDAEPTKDYPDGYVRFYNEKGEPVGLDGKPGSKAHTHIPKNPDGSYPTPKGWNP